MSGDTKSVDPRQFAAEVLELTGLTAEQIAELPKVTKYVDLKGSKWQVMDPVPGITEMQIFCIFRDEEDIFVYASPRAAQTAKGEPLSPTRFVLHRRAASLVVEQMTWATYKEEIADEFIAQWEGAVEEDGDDEDGGDGQGTGAADSASGVGEAPEAGVSATPTSSPVV